MSEPADALTIRRAQPHEREALEELQRRASLALPDYREQLIASPDAISLPAEQVVLGQVLVAELAGRLAGFAAVLIDEREAELDGLFVEPDLWRQGIGRSLADAATLAARRRGLSLRVTAAPAARAFYEACGFAVEGEEQTRFGPALRMTR